MWEILTFYVDLFLPFGWGKFNQNWFSDLLLVDWLIHKLQVQHFWLNLSYSNGKNKSTSNVKEIHICQWISFHILTFHILEEMAYCQVLSQVNNHKGR